MIERRRIMITNKLPYDAEIEYLESSGTQYIDTGIIPTNNIGVEISILYSNTKGTFIAGGNSWQAEFFIGRASDSIIFNSNNSSGLRISGANGFVNTRHTYKYENGDCYIDGIKEGTNSPNIPSTTKTLCVFCYNRSTGNGEFCIGKIYYVKIWSGNELKRDMIPVRVGQVGYLYDKVSGQLFGNGGTGDFVLGSDKEGGIL